MNGDEGSTGRLGVLGLRRDRINEHAYQKCIIDKYNIFCECYFP
jgi:hypothetical protein